MLLVVLLLTHLCDAGKVYEKGVNAKEESLIVKIHNDMRLKLARGELEHQPRASNLKRLKYDAALAHEAQKIAEKCKFKHEDVYDDRWKHVGQNLYFKRSTSRRPGADWKHALDKWFNEYHEYKYSKKWQPGTGHYTQVVGDLTELIGCGYALCEPMGNQTKYVNYYVCNYGPMSNYAGRFPYKSEGLGCENLC